MSALNTGAQRLFGRRRGRRLRRGQMQLFTQALPAYRLSLETLGRHPASGALWLEIGFGGGEHLAAMAAAHPNVSFIGCDIYENGIVGLLAQLEARALANVRIMIEDARLVLAALPEASLGRLCVLFPDPWPKTRHHKRRLIGAPILDQAARVLGDGAELRLATDDIEYLRVMLSVACDHPAFEWTARRPSDWSDRPSDWPPTRYEAKAIAAGRKPAFLRLVRRNR